MPASKKKKSKKKRARKQQQQQQQQQQNQQENCNIHQASKDEEQRKQLVETEPQPSPPSASSKRKRKKKRGKKKRGQGTMPHCDYPKAFVGEPADAHVEVPLVLRFSHCARLGCTSAVVEATKRCSRCQCTFYCSRECQREHWALHKLVCRAPVANPIVAASKELESMAEDPIRRTGLQLMSSMESVEHADLWLPLLRKVARLGVQSPYYLAALLHPLYVTAVTARTASLRGPNTAVWQPEHIDALLQCVRIVGNVVGQPGFDNPAMSERHMFACMFAYSVQADSNSADVHLRGLLAALQAAEKVRPVQRFFTDNDCKGAFSELILLCSNPISGFHKTVPLAAAHHIPQTATLAWGVLNALMTTLTPLFESDMYHLGFVQVATLLPVHLQGDARWCRAVLDNSRQWLARWPVERGATQLRGRAFMLAALSAIQYEQGAFMPQLGAEQERDLAYAMAVRMGLDACKDLLSSPDSDVHVPVGLILPSVERSALIAKMSVCRYSRNLNAMDPLKVEQLWDDVVHMAQELDGPDALSVAIQLSHAAESIRKQVASAAANGNTLPDAELKGVLERVESRALDALRILDNNQSPLDILLLVEIQDAALNALLMLELARLDFDAALKLAKRQLALYEHPSVPHVLRLDDLRQLVHWLTEPASGLPIPVMVSNDYFVHQAIMGTQTE